MSKRRTDRAKDPFKPIAQDKLAKVAGGAARVTGRNGAANDQMLQLMTQIGTSIKDLAAKQNTGSDPSQMMMMMMMMGGLGGGGGAAAAPAGPPPGMDMGGGGAPMAPAINITVSAKAKR